MTGARPVSCTPASEGLELAFAMHPRQNLFFVDLVQAIRGELDALGVPSSIHHDGLPAPRPGLVCVLTPPHEYIRLAGGLGPSANPHLRRCIGLCAEQPGTEHFEGDVRVARRLGAVFDLNPANEADWSERGLAVRPFALGYTPAWDGPSPEVDRDVDVCFLGSRSDRRLLALSRYGASLWRWRCQLVLADDTRPHFQTGPDYLAGAEKRALLRRSRVLLNIHADERAYFETLRVCEAIHCGAVVISEHAPPPAWLAPGRDYLAGRLPTLALLAQSVLEDPELERRVRDQARRSLLTAPSLRDAVRDLLDTARRLDVSSAPEPRLSPEPIDPQRGPAFPGPGRLVAGADPEVAGIRRTLKRVTLELLETRRELARLHSRLMLEPPAEVELVGHSPSWRAATPSLSVLVSVHDYEDRVTGALDSVAASAHHDLELVVVDDGSRDRSRAVVRAWCAAHPEIPTLLLAHPHNRGLAHARNAAVDFARGAVVFVLDADNEVYPHGLRRLADALEANPQASFAYGLIERFDDGGSAGLVSVGGWEPARLAERNYIDAMALIRRRALREVGMYATDPRLQGWEDYDLWCAMAERGHRGTSVREIVGRYRVSVSGMAHSLTDISYEDAYATLEERHPLVMAGGTASAPGA